MIMVTIMILELLNNYSVSGPVEAAKDNEIELYGSLSVLSLIKEISFHHIERACGRSVNQK